MRLDVAITSGDYTSTAKVVEFKMTDGERSLRGINLRVAGSAAADAFAGVYHAAAGKTSLTDAERALGHIWSDSAVAAAANPTPDVSVGGDEPIDFTLRSGESLYVYWKSGTGDTAVSVDGYIEIR